MKRLLLIIALMLAPHVAVLAQKPFTKPTQSKSLLVISSTAYWTAVFADIQTSRGPNKYETSPLARNSRGGISVPKAMGIAAAPYALSLWLDHKHRAKAATWLRFGFAGGHFAAAVWNSRQGGTR